VWELDGPSPILNRSKALTNIRLALGSLLYGDGRLDS
jgi:hypothetical protein